MKSSKSLSMEAFLENQLSGKLFTWRQIVNLLIPGVLDTMSITLISMLTTALISKNGQTSVAAVSLVGPISSLIVCLFLGLCDGGSIIVAQCCGRDEPSLLRKAIGMLVWLTMLLCTLVCAPILLLPRTVLLTVYPQIEADVLEKAVIYLTGNVISIFPYALYSALFRVLRGLGQSRRCLILSIVINAGYLVFSYIFLNILHMDIYGSVIALNLARTAGAVTAIAALFLWKPPIRLKFRQLFCCDAGILRSSLKIGIPFAVEKICTSCGSLVFQMFLTGLGTAMIATHAVTNSLLGVLHSPALAAGNVAVAVIGRCIGAGEKEEAYRYGKRCVNISRILLIAAGLIFYPLLPVLLRQYNPTAEAADMASRLLLLCIPFLLVFWPNANIMPSALRSSGDTLFPTLVSLGVLWIVNIGLGYILAIHTGLGLLGIWIATWAGWAIQGCIFVFRFRSRKWLSKSAIKSVAKN